MIKISESIDQLIGKVSAGEPIDIRKELHLRSLIGAKISAEFAEAAIEREKLADDELKERLLGNVESTTAENI
jgi:hypothetical protein